MQIKTYYHLDIFKLFYLREYSKSGEPNLLEYLLKLKKHYWNLHCEFSDIELKNVDLGNRLKDLNFIYFLQFTFDDMDSDLVFRLDDDDVKLFLKHFTEENKKFILLRLQENTTDILDELENEIIRIDSQNKFEISEDELTPSQTQKIGLLIRSGIIEFLREKNPKISDNKISGFLQLLTSEPLKQSSINPHLTTNLESVKHPFFGSGKIDEIDLILKRYGISPQSEQ